MNDSNAFKTIMPAGTDRPVNLPAPSRDILTEILHDGAQRLPAQAIDAEVGDWIDRHAELVDRDGRRQVVRNGHHPTRTILTGVGPIEVAVKLPIENEYLRFLKHEGDLVHGLRHPNIVSILGIDPYTDADDLADEANDVLGVVGVVGVAANGGALVLLDPGGRPRRRRGSPIRARRASEGFRRPPCNRAGSGTCQRRFARSRAFRPCGS